MASARLPTDMRTERACFDGTLLSALAYGTYKFLPFSQVTPALMFTSSTGALLMLYCQLSESMWLRPKRGRVFYGIIAFAVTLFILSTVAIGGRFRFAEMIYIENRTYEFGPKVWYLSNSDRWENVMAMSRCVLIIVTVCRAVAEVLAVSLQSLGSVICSW